MRLQVSSSGVGPRSFTKRLVRYLKKHHNVKIDKIKPHVYLSSVWRGNPPKRCVAIHRMDGAYFNSDLANGPSMNKQIAKAVKKAHGVVYQSEYSRKMCEGILGVNKKGVIIHNGFDPQEYDGICSDKMGYDKMFVACAKWRGLKRPRSIAKGFLEADVPNSVLIMIGEIGKKDKVKDSRIKYVGKVDTTDTYKYYVSCDAVIHISRLDACPNVAVEALVAGKPVICNNVGGTPEIVKDSGVILDIDPPLKYRTFSMGKPDRVKPKIIAAGIETLLSKQWNVDRPDLHMKTCALQYYKYFMHVLSEGR